MLEKSKLQNTPLQKACEGFALELIADVSPDTPGKIRKIRTEYRGDPYATRVLVVVQGVDDVKFCAVNSIF